MREQAHTTEQLVEYIACDLGFDETLDDYRRRVNVGRRRRLRHLVRFN